MSLWQIAWHYLWSRKLPTLLTVLSVALGVGLISAVHTLREETRRRFEEEGQAFDIVVGAKGSPLQLVLSSVYFLDRPTGNISYADFEHIRDHEDVAEAYPIGLGDTYRNYRIVGTVPELMEVRWVVDPISGRERIPFQLAEGRFFEEPLEAVVGSIVARNTGLRVGDTFTGTHGFEGGHVHDDHPYKVVGILETSGTPNDRAIFCNIEDIWLIHEEHDHDHHDETHNHDHDHDHSHDHDHHHHDHDHSHVHEFDKADHDAEDLEVTAVLVTLESPALRFTFMEYVMHETNVMAAVPVMEIQQLYSQILGTANTVLLSVAYLVVVVAALTVMIGLYLAILQRRRDLAIMRSLGASTMDIFGAVILEALLVTILGIVAGWFLGNVVSWGLGIYLTRTLGMAITAFDMSMHELRSFAIVALFGLLAGILPAWQAYQTHVAGDLTKP